MSTSQNMVSKLDGILQEAEREYDADLKRMALNIALVCVALVLVFWLGLHMSFAWSVGLVGMIVFALAILGGDGMWQRFYRLPMSSIKRKYKPLLEIALQEGNLTQEELQDLVTNRHERFIDVFP